MRSQRLLVVLGILLLVAGCGGAKTVSGPAPVRIWHWMTDRDNAFQELARRYKDATGTDVRFELYAPSDVYIQKVRSAAQTNGLPDVYGVLGESRDLASFINAGHVLRLDEAMNHTASEVWPHSKVTMRTQRIS